MFCLNQEHLIGETHNMIIEVLYSMHSFDIIFYVHCQIILQYFALFFIFLYIYKVKVTSLHYRFYDTTGQVFSFCELHNASYRSEKLGCTWTEPGQGLVWRHNGTCQQTLVLLGYCRASVE